MGAREKEGKGRDDRSEVEGDQGVHTERGFDRRLTESRVMTVAVESAEVEEEDVAADLLRMNGGIE